MSCLLSMSVYSQDTVKSFALRPIEELPIWIDHSPGQELALCSKHYYTGLSLITIGSLVSLSGNMIGEQTPQSTVLLGASIGIIGSFLVIESHIHLRRAGLIMDRRGVGISIQISH